MFYAMLNYSIVDWKISYIILALIGGYIAFMVLAMAMLFVWLYIGEPIWRQVVNIYELTPIPDILTWLEKRFGLFGSGFFIGLIILVPLIAGTLLLDPP